MYVPIEQWRMSTSRTITKSYKMNVLYTNGSYQFCVRFARRPVLIWWNWIEYNSHWLNSIPLVSLLRSIQLCIRKSFSILNENYSHSLVVRLWHLKVIFGSARGSWNRGFFEGNTFENDVVRSEKKTYHFCFHWRIVMMRSGLWFW